MGKSRSATVVVAYLMWKFGMTAKAALEQLCEGRPVCEPNPGFCEQLGVWERMLKVREGEERERVYRDWIENRYTGTWYNGEFLFLFVASCWLVMFCCDGRLL